jgi:very-short-patch-repair endonuclease
MPKFKKLPYNENLLSYAKTLRKAGNLSEVLLWEQLKRKRLCGLDFDRQKVIGNYIVDFICEDRNFVIEIDGFTHDDKVKQDAERDRYFEELGLEVLHILDGDVKGNLDGVVFLIKQRLGLE